MKKGKNINVTSMIEKMLAKAEDEWGRAHEKLRSSVDKMEMEISSHKYALKEHGTNVNVGQLMMKADYVKRCAKKAQDATDKLHVILVMMGITALTMKERPELYKYFSVGRWKDEYEMEIGPEDGEDMRGVDKDWERVSSYPPQMRGLFEYILLNKR